MNRVWKFAPAVCLFVALLCVIVGRMDAAFVIATLGVVAWFVETRNRLRADDIESDVPEDPTESDGQNNRGEYS